MSSQNPSEFEVNATALILAINAVRKLAAELCCLDGPRDPVTIPEAEFPPPVPVPPSLSGPREDPVERLSVALRESLQKVEELGDLFTARSPACHEKTAEGIRNESKRWSANVPRPDDESDPNAWREKCIQWDREGLRLQRKLLSVRRMPVLRKIEPLFSGWKKPFLFDESADVARALQWVICTQIRPTQQAFLELGIVSAPDRQTDLKTDPAHFLESAQQGFENIGGALEVLQSHYPRSCGERAKKLTEALQVCAAIVSRISCNDRSTLALDAFEAYQELGRVERRAELLAENILNLSQATETKVMREESDGDGALYPLEDEPYEDLTITFMLQGTDHRVRFESEKRDERTVDFRTAGLMQKKRDKQNRICAWLMTCAEMEVPILTTAKTGGEGENPEGTLRNAARDLKKWFQSITGRTDNPFHKGRGVRNGYRFRCVLKVDRRDLVHRGDALHHSYRGSRPKKHKTDDPYDVAEDEF